MIIVFKPKTTDKDVQKIVKQVEDKGLTTHIVVGTETTICGVIGDVTKVDPKQLEVSPVVDHVMRVSEPYKLANRAFHPEDSIIDMVKNTIIAAKTAVFKNLFLERSIFSTLS